MFLNIVLSYFKYKTNIFLKIYSKIVILIILYRQKYIQIIYQLF